MANPCREFIQVFKTHFQFSVQPLVAEISMIKYKNDPFLQSLIAQREVVVSKSTKKQIKAG